MALDLSNTSNLEQLALKGLKFKLLLKTFASETGISDNAILTSEFRVRDQSQQTAKRSDTNCSELGTDDEVHL